MIIFIEGSYTRSRRSSKESSVNRKEDKQTVSTYDLFYTKTFLETAYPTERETNRWLEMKA